MPSFNSASFVHLRPKASNDITVYQKIVVDPDMPHDLYLHYAIASMHDYMSSLIATIDPYGSLKSETLCAGVSYRDLDGFFRINIIEADKANEFVNGLRGNGIEYIKVKFIGVFPSINLDTIPTYIEFKEIPESPIDKFYGSLDSFLQSNETVICGIKIDKDDMIDFKLPN